ncbi:hypothetical protein ABT247_01770 [Kitasatospora sp. NPDC001539]|uniref:hypothetical protein n=1 Tax=Kitasatospora sp. NPDC001539 TaxID=3154384 RepID=UPI0033275EB8
MAMNSVTRTICLASVIAGVIAVVTVLRHACATSASGSATGTDSGAGGGSQAADGHIGCPPGGCRDVPDPDQ